MPIVQPMPPADQDWVLWLNRRAVLPSACTSPHHCFVAAISLAEANTALRAAERVAGRDNPARRLPTESAFTLVELLVVLAIIGVLASLILPALAHAKARATGTVCLNNLKQLQTGWQMYVDDYDSFVPPNTAHYTNGAWRSTPDSWTGHSSAPHDPDSTPLEGGVLFRHGYARSARLFHCPADRATVRTVGGEDLGLVRTRSYALNGNLGGRSNEAQRVVLRAGDIPNPSQLFVFIDEHPDSIDDGHFLVWPAPDDRWVNLPADRHGQAGVLSFADGHVERWKWRWPKRFYPRQGYWKQAENAQDRADLRQLQAVLIAATESAPNQGRQ